MIIFEIIFQSIFEGIVVGALTWINNGILKLRGIETRPIEEVRFDKLKKRYQYKSIVLRSRYNKIPKGSKGTVLELIDSKKAFVEFEQVEEVIEVPLSKILVKRKKNKS